MKKIVILLLIAVGCLTLTGCSFDKDKANEKFDDYFYWFEEEFGEPEQTENSEESSFELVMG